MNSPACDIIVETNTRNWSVLSLHLNSICELSKFTPKGISENALSKYVCTPDIRGMPYKVKNNLAKVFSVSCYFYKDMIFNSKSTFNLPAQINL